MFKTILFAVLDFLKARQDSKKAVEEAKCSAIEKTFAAQYVLKIRSFQHGLIFWTLTWNFIGLSIAFYGFQIEKTGINFFYITVLFLLNLLSAKIYMHENEIKTELIDKFRLEAGSIKKRTFRYLKTAWFFIQLLLIFMAVYALNPEEINIFTGFAILAITISVAAGLGAAEF